MLEGFMRTALQVGQLALTPLEKPVKRLKMTNSQYLYIEQRRNHAIGSVGIPWECPGTEYTAPPV